MSALPAARASLPSPRNGTSRLLIVEVRDVIPSPDSPRVEPGDVSALAASIAEHGLLEPLQVQRLLSGHWMLRPGAGLRRLTALRLLGRSQVEVIVRRETTPDRVLAAALTQDSHQREFSEHERTQGYRRMRSLGRSSAEVARLVTRREGTSENRPGPAAVVATEPASVMATSRPQVPMQGPPARISAAGAPGVMSDGLVVSERQLAIGRLIASGKSNAEIAIEIGVSMDTVKIDLRRLGVAMGSVVDRTAIVVNLMRRGLID